VFVRVVRDLKTNSIFILLAFLLGIKYTRICWSQTQRDEAGGYDTPGGIAMASVEISAENVYLQNRRKGGKQHGK